MKVTDIKYQRIERDEFTKAFDEIIAEVKTAKSGEQLIEIRNKRIELLSHLVTMSSLAYVRFTLNTKDEFYLKEKDYYDEFSPEVQVKDLEFAKAFLASKHLKDAEKLINPLVIKQYELSLKCSDEKILPDMVNENKLVTEYSKLMSETLFEFRGESIPLSALKGYFKDKDRAVRREAYEACGKTLEGISDKLDSIFGELVKVRDKMARELGYKNYVELGDNRMGRISYDRKMIEAFRQNVLDYIVPLNVELKAGVKEDLGISDNFMMFDNDTYFKHGNPQPVLNAEQMFEAAKNMYHDMSAETAEFIDMMLKNQAFDVFPKEGKWGGGYCTSLPDFKQPFILANFNGSSDDVDVLTHEAGHALADFMGSKLGNDFDLAVGGMETAETHSMSMEFFCWKYIDKFFGDRGDDYRYMHVMEAINFIPYGTIVDYFQQQCYENPNMAPQQRNALWKQLETKFRPQLSIEGIPYIEKGTRWQYQMHIYETPLYYIDYCLAQSVALQFLAASLKDYKAAFNKYFEFLSTGGGAGFPELIKKAGLQSPFKEGAMKQVAAETKKIIENIK